jgi:hypothetical protein
MTASWGNYSSEAAEEAERAEDGFNAESAENAEYDFNAEPAESAESILGSAGHSRGTIQSVRKFCFTDPSATATFLPRECD